MEGNHSVNSGVVLIVIGIIVALLGIVRHFSQIAVVYVPHLSSILVVLGVIILIIGIAVNTQTTRR